MPGLLTSSGARAPKQLDPHVRARSLHRQAVAEGRFGHAARAVRTLRRGLELLDRECADRSDCRALTVELLLSLAVNEAEVHGVDRGREVLAQAQAVLDRIDEPALRVRMHNNHVLIATRAGDLDTAGTERDRALQLLPHASPHDRVYTLLNGGNIHLYRGELAEARRLLRRAAAEAQAESLRDPQFRALHNLGYVEFLGGNLPAALAAMDSAAEIDVPVSRGIWALDRARILLEAGLVQEADAALAGAWRIFAADRTAQDLGEVEVARAECALLLGDAQAARRYAGRARDRFRRRGNDAWTRTAELVLLQGDLAAGRPGTRLAPVADRLEHHLGASGQPARARTAALVGVEARLAAGLVGEATAVVERLDRHAAADPITARAHGRYVHAQLALARRDLATARREVRAGLTELAAYQAGFGSIDLQTASAVHGRRLAALDLELAVRDGRPAGVLAAVERSRAVSTRMPPVRPPSDEQSAELLAELRRVVEAVRGGGGDAARLARRAELERAVQERAWSLPGGGRAARAAGADAIRAVVRDLDVALAAYLVVRGRLHALVVDGPRSRLVTLGEWAAVEQLARRVRADFDVLAVELVPEPLKRVVATSLGHSLGALDAALLAPLGVTDRPLVVVPTGLLGALPWSSLPSRRGVPLAVAPSATAWLRAREVPAARGAVAALAGPGLHRAEHEARDVADAWAASATSVSVVAPAGREALAAALRTAQVVHVAAHGQHQTENPLFSSIRLADGPLFAYELDSSAAHVVLSACELGTATVRAGDEALGLTSVLLHLGTRSVVSSVARVGDRTAEATMASYHARLTRGEDSAAALAGALADAVDSGASPVPPPFVTFGSAWARPAPTRGS